MASNFDMSSSNLSLNIVIPEYNPNGFTVEYFSTENMIDFEPVENKHIQMGADSKLSAGLIYNPIPLVIHLKGSSPSIDRFIDWRDAELLAGKTYMCNATLTYPSLARRYEFSNGILVSLPPAPPAGRILGDFVVTLNFESMAKNKIG